MNKNKRLEIANICHANVLGNFAMFCNSMYKGEKFSWVEFVQMQETAAPSWMYIHGVKGNKEEIDALAIEFASDIAARAVKRAGFVS